MPKVEFERDVFESDKKCTKVGKNIVATSDLRPLFGLFLHIKNMSEDVKYIVAKNKEVDAKIKTYELKTH
jgi:hypothetical protein